MRQEWVILLVCAGLAGAGAAAFPPHPREATEWVSMRAYNANRTDQPRVLLIGDSICAGYEGSVRRELAGTAYVTSLATSKCVCDATYLDLLRLTLAEAHYDVIHFNNGLHSLYSDRAHWEARLHETVHLLKASGGGPKLIWATATPLQDPALTAKAVELNKIAARVMAEEGVPTDDLFALMNPLDRGTYWSDTYHYKQQAVQMQARAIADCIRAALGKGKAPVAAAEASLRSAATATGPSGALK